MKLFAILLLALLTPALRAADDLVSLHFDNTLAKDAAAQLARLEGKKITLQLDTATGRRPVKLNLDGVPRDQAASFLLYALNAAGVVIESQPDGSLLARVGVPTAARPAGARAGDGALAFEMSNVSAEIVARRVAGLEGKTYAPGTDDEALAAAARTITAKVENAATPAAAATALRATLREQGGVVLDEQPRGTLRLRVVAPPAPVVSAPAAPVRLPGPPPPPDKSVAPLDLVAAPVAAALDTLREISGWEISAPAEVLAADVKINFQIRAAIPAREAAVALRSALIEQAGLILDDEPGGKLSARILPKPTPVFQNP